MNAKKWVDPQRRLFEIIVKLQEEVGEVSKAYLDKGALERLDEELSHVVFIAEVLRWRIVVKTEELEKPPMIRSRYGDEYPT